MQENTYPSAEGSPSSAIRPRRERVKDAEKESARCLGSRGALVPLLIAFLFFSLTAVGCGALYSVLSVFCARLGAPGAADTACLVLAVLFFLFFAMPAFFGRMRLSGLTLLGEEVSAREVLHYYTSPRLLGRSFVLSLAYLTALFAPYAVAAGGIAGSVSLLENILLPELNVTPATGIFLLCCVLALVLGALTFLASGLLIFAPGIAVGNEELPLTEAFRHAFSVGKKHILTVCVYRVRSIVFVLLSLLTVGVLYVLYFAHRIQLTYLCLCMELKGDSQ